MSLEQDELFKKLLNKILFISDIIHHKFSFIFIFIFI